ncbi:MAG: WD40 repeat domain-containing protein, partial [Chloroflexi bacterium]|nr:WD40 repeat domain-containing protein [Chloroflexota bacterium]
MTSLSLKNSISSVLNQSISQIQKSTPLAVGILLSSAALLPTIQSAPAELAAGLAIGGTLLSGLGTNLITDLIKEKLYKVAGKKYEEILKETEKALLELWNEGGKKGEDFRKELSTFLQRNGILQMAMDGVPQETKNALLSSFAELAEKFDEFNWALKYIQESLAEISATGRQQVEASNEILAKVNLLLQMQRENQKKAPLPLEPKQGEEEQPRTEIENPYKGLAFFTQADGNTYFGREELTAQLLAKLAGSPFLALLGASGSGKSSLMRAGVIWALYTGGIPGSENWKVLVMRPGATPLEDLAAQVSAESRSVSSSLIREIKTDPSTLRLEAKKILLNLPDDAKLVLAVDQFEEVFTQCLDENERGQFIAALTDAAQHSNSRIVVLLTLRADYYGRTSTYPALAKLLSENQVLVSEMTDAELRRAISAPAENVGVRVEAGLPELIIEEARGEKGALPMISLALAELFKNRKTDTLKVAEYCELGGLNQVIATTADKAYLSFSQAEQTLARKILLDLVKTGETAEQDARQRVRLSALVSADKNSIQVEELLNKLADTRLIVKDGESEEAQVEVAHEALFRHWDKLRDWLEEAREEKNLRQKISEAANEWKQNNKDANLLVHRGGRLDDAMKLRELTPDSLEYVKACDALRRKEQRDRERQTRITVFASIAAAVVFLVLGAFGLAKSSEAEEQAATAQANANVAATAQANAEEQAKIALARQLAAQAHLLYQDDNSKQMIASLLSAQSMKLFPIADAARLLVNDNHSALLLMRKEHDEAVTSVAFSPDGEYVVSGSWDGTTRVWDVQTGVEIVRKTVPEAEILSVAFSPDGKLVVSGDSDSNVIIWDAKTGGELVHMTHFYYINSVAFSPDGKYVVSGSGGGDNAVRIWNAKTGEEVSHMFHDSSVVSVTFSPDGKNVVSSSWDGTARVWDAQTGAEIVRKTVPDEFIYSVAFSPDGKYVISGDSDSTVSIWNSQTGEELNHMTHESLVLAVAFSPDGKFVVSGSGGDNMARVWDVQS